MKKTVVMIRIALTLVLIYQVYLETAFFTAFCFILIFVTTEIQNMINEKHRLMYLNGTMNIDEFNKILKGKNT